LILLYILQFWRGTLGEANEAFATRQPKGEITVLIEGKLISDDEIPSEDFLEHELRELTAKGYTLSAVHMQLNSFYSISFNC
jgi:16S rRNA (cytidine1402-2'-O)-methyltransferase